MSLPDTVFIFVLALIIFGPKKLPEIGRQLGKLVGEFRRASNEFKFQIEEELRLAEFSDRPPIAPRSKELEASNSTPSSPEPANEPDLSTSPDLPDSEEILPAGQYPNIENLDPYELDALHGKLQEPEPAEEQNREEIVEESAPALPSIAPATGTEPRTTPPHLNSEFDEIASAEMSSPGVGGDKGLPSHGAGANGSSMASASQTPDQEPVNTDAAHAVADMTHG